MAENQGAFFLKEAECPVEREEKKVAGTFRESKNDSVSGHKHPSGQLWKD